MSSRLAERALEYALYQMKKSMRKQGLSHGGTLEHLDERMERTRWALREGMDDCQPDGDEIFLATIGALLAAFGAESLYRKGDPEFVAAKPKENPLC